MKGAQERATSLIEAAGLASTRGDYDTLQRTALELIAWSETHEDTRTLAEGYRYLGGALMFMQDARASELAFGRALELCEETGDRYGATLIKVSLGSLAMELNLDVVEGRRLIDETLPVMREIGDPVRLGITLGNLAEVCRQEGAYDDAIAAAQESLEIFREAGDTARAGAQLTTVAHCHALKRDYPAAIGAMNAAFELFGAEPNPKFGAYYFDVWFVIAARLRSWEVAGRLFGFLEEYRDKNRVPRLRVLFPWFAPSIENVARNLGDERLSHLRAEGARLAWTQARELTAQLARS